MKISVENINDQSTRELELEAFCISQDINEYLISLAVRWHRANLRSGNHAVKTRSQVNATRRKMFRQKGTGNARRGSKTTNILRGGGVSHGPVVRSHAFTLPKKVRLDALCSALSMKFKNEKLKIIDAVDFHSAKTKDCIVSMQHMNTKSVVVFYGNECDYTNLKQASANVPYYDVINVLGVNTLDIVKHDYVLLTIDAFNIIEERCNRYYA